MVHTDRKPNILILVTDQQSHDLLSCAGTNWVSTRHLDRLAASGTRFTRAYCSDPVCIPSRFSMFTGRMPSAIGMRGNGGRNMDPWGPGFATFAAEQEQACLGHVLRQAGYATWYGGKVHMPIGLSPERLGFTTFSRDERESLAIEAADLIHHHAAQPWAMVVSLINPHDICYQAIRTFATTGDALDQRIMSSAAVPLANLDAALRPPPGVTREDFLRDHLPPLPANHEIQRDEPEMIAGVLAERPFKAAARTQWGEQEWRLHRWAYARLMERVDRQIGVVLDALAASGQEQDTLVVMTSDHGDHAGSHRLEHKTFFYDEAARVPWLMRLPGRIRAGAVEEALVATGLDLMATLCDYAGVPVPAHCLGLSQRAAAEGRPGPRRDLVYGENAISRMVRQGQWKYVRYDGGANAEQLYDLARDPGETMNHAQDPANAAVLAALRAQLDREIAAHAALALLPPGADAGRAGE